MIVYNEKKNEEIKCSLAENWLNTFSGICSGVEDSCYFCLKSPIPPSGRNIFLWGSSFPLLSSKPPVSRVFWECKQLRNFSGAKLENHCLIATIEHKYSYFKL